MQNLSFKSCRVTEEKNKLAARYEEKEAIAKSLSVRMKN